MIFPKFADKIEKRIDFLGNMKINKINRSLSELNPIMGLLALFPLPFYFLIIDTTPYANVSSIILASASSVAWIAYIFFTPKFAKLSKVLGTVSILFLFAIILPIISENPFWAFISIISFISIIVTIQSDYFSKVLRFREKRTEKMIHISNLSILIMVAINYFLGISKYYESNYILAISLLTPIVLNYITINTHKNKVHKIFLLLCAIIVILSFVTHLLNWISQIALIVIAVQFILLPKNLFKEKSEHWWDVFINQPARLLLTTFLTLCTLGTIILSFPISSSSDGISFVDALFTSVSAVCVTGLIVLDTPVDFSMFGHISILLLIQLGGLGIMSITTVALHAMGLRFSLKQERILTSIADTSHKDLINALSVILKFTFISEVIGAIILTTTFYFCGEFFNDALMRGIFTSISAFCNAGFALQSDSLVQYQGNPVILNTVSFLIILGGIAPATSILIPRWIKGKTIPIPSKIALVTTLILLLTGTILILIFEWNSIFEGMNFFEKVQNAWFQSVTLRTAGFNSVDISLVSNPTYIIMIIFMFIGGSPGGTAGGIKTTTIGIIASTFWANIRNHNDVIIQKRRIHNSTIFRALTVIVSGIMIWFIFVIMIEVTQAIPARDVIFEVTSALGTVGLSTGATSQLDDLGKMIIIITMFIGRIGPITLFMLLSHDQSSRDSKYPDEKISLN